MKKSCRRSVRSLLFAAAILLAAGTAAVACPFCVKSESLSSQIFGCDAAVVVSRVSGEEGADGEPGTTLVRVDRILHISPALKKSTSAEAETINVGAPPPKVGDEISVRYYYPPKEGTQYLLRGADPENFVWGDRLVEVTDEVLTYVLAAPPIDAPGPERGAYYLQFLETDNPQIAADAYAEFGSMPYEDVQALRDRLPKEKLRRWLFDEQVPGVRIGLYGLMLGLCGNQDDAKLLEKKILDRTSEFRLGIDGVMGGYLLLTGESGLKFIKENVLKQKEIASGELLSAMQAMRFMWTYGDDRISKQQLRDAMRLMIDHPLHIDMAIRDLSRWDDWLDMDRVVALYGTPGYDDLTVKVAIIKYVIAATNRPGEDTAENKAIKAAARKHLEALRERDPKLVQRAERFSDLE